MNKVGIITLHFYENFGSVLQAYATKTAIEKFSGCKAEVIHYWPQIEEYNYFSDEYLKRMFKNKQKLFNEFRQKRLGIQGQRITSMKDYDYSSYDSFITGSDQVWNPDITQLDPAYFLDFVPDNCRKIAYATSLAIDKNCCKFDENKFKRLLNHLDYISLREKTHEDYVQQFTEKSVCTVLDPTMLLQESDYHEIIAKERLEEEKYILLYFLTHDAAAIDWANILAKRFGYKIIHYFADMPDRVFVSNSKTFAFAGPEEFLWYIKNAELIFTNSFHGTVFSILFEKPFYTYTAKRDMLSRVLDLTEILDLKDRQMCGYRNVNELTTDIEYKNTKERLEMQREYSMNFLKNALGVDNENC